MEPVTSPEGKKGFYDESTGFIPIDSMQKVTNPQGVKGYYHETAGFVPEPSANKPPPSKGFWGSMGEMAGNIPGSAANVAGGIVSTLAHPLESAKNLFMTAMGEPGRVEAMGNALAQRYGGLENIKQTAIKDPVGMAIDVSTLTGLGGGATKMAGLTDTSKVLSKVSEYTNPLSALTKPVKGAISLLPESFERGMLQRVNKFSTTLSDAERTRRLDTQLNEGIRTTKAGLAKSKGTIADINNEIQGKIDELSGGGVTVSKDKVVSPAESWRDTQMAKQGLPKKPTEDINSIIGEFKDTHPEKLTLRQAQDFKQSFNLELDSFYKAANSSPDKTAALAQKWINKSKAKIADGLRAEISGEWPEVKGLNEKEASLIQLNKSLIRSLNRIGNRDTLSLKFLVALIKHPLVAVGELTLNNPTIQSSLAVAIRQARLKGGTPARSILKTPLPLGATAGLPFQGEQELNTKRKEYGSDE